MTKPEAHLRDFVNQTLRWNNGGLFSPDRMTRFNFNFLMLMISTGTLAVPLLPFLPKLWPLPLGVLIAMIMNTIIALGPFGKDLPHAGAAYLFQLLFTQYTLPSLPCSAIAESGLPGKVTRWNKPRPLKRYSVIAFPFKEVFTIPIKSPHFLGKFKYENQRL
jgi:hypothetical protein